VKVAAPARRITPVAGCWGRTSIAVPAQQIAAAAERYVPAIITANVEAGSFSIIKFLLKKRGRQIRSLNPNEKYRRNIVSLINMSERVLRCGQ
jgi:hypothetical protein